MSFHRHSQSVYHFNDYSWADSDATVREVLAAVLSRRLFVRIEPTLESFQFADKLYAAQWQRLKERTHEWYTKYSVAPKFYSIEVIRAYDTAALAGGLSKFLAAIIYRCLRMKQDSTVVAEHLGASPQQVRRVLDHMHGYAKKLADGKFKFPKRSVADEVAKQKQLEYAANYGAKWTLKPPKKPLKKPVFVPNPTGVCQCGCGELCDRIKQTERWKGRIKGEFSMFRPGHVSRVRPGSGRPKKAAIAA